MGEELTVEALEMIDGGSSETIYQKIQEIVSKVYEAIPEWFE